MYALVHQKTLAIEKDRLIREFVPLLNELRSVLCQYPLEMLADETRAGVERHIIGMYRVMQRLGLEDDGTSPEESVATHAFVAEGFHTWSPKAIRQLFLTELPRDILGESRWIATLTPTLLRDHLSDLRATLADAYYEDRKSVV